ncbi:MFS transporter [Rhodococcus pyridinivorans]|uniref:MFS transporter n=1 Tax=Rhodococcus pyridinivorans TaxID=103816 RepID=A0A7M2XWT9_9NOCA|nr:MFS transporter [Rhodococcus pyridinivorans]QOW02048.1 MFS transporter [Rhodococcus pyridinivorans]
MPEQFESARKPMRQRQLPRPLMPFRHSAYRRLALALVLSAFASGIWIVAQVWEVIRIGGGTAQLSVVSTAGAVGVLLPSLLAGVVADRVPQKLILLCVASVRVVGMCLVAALSVSDNTRLWHLATVALMTGMASAFYYPAYNAWIPALVPEKDLMAVNGFEGMIRPTIGQAIGPGVAGAVVGAFSSGAALGIAAAASMASLAALALVPLTSVRQESAVEVNVARGVRSALIDMRDGVSYVVRTPWLLATLLFASVMMLMMAGPFEVLVPFLIKDQLDGGPGDHALVMAAFGIGGAVGSLTMASLRMPRRYLTVMNMMWGVSCLPFLAVAFADGIVVVVGASCVLGAMFTAPSVIWGTLLQRRSPPHMLGRLASLDSFVSISLIPVSMALSGPVSNALGLGTTFVIAAVVPVIAAVLATVCARLPADEVAHPLKDGSDQVDISSAPERS